MRVHHPAIDIRWVLLRAGLTVLLIGLLAPLFSFLLPRPVGAVSLTIASSTSSTPESMNNTTFAATDTSIASSSLPAGTYLVTWGAALSNSNSTRSSFARLVRGSTEIGLAGSEMNSATTANNGRSPGGFWLGTLDGTEALTIEYRVDNTSSTAYIDSKYIKAIRLDDKLTQDIDYFTTGSQESGTDEVTDAATGSPTTVKSLTKTFHSTISQDYLVLASMEISPDSTANDCAAQLTVDSGAVTTQTGEGEDATDIYTYVAADLRTIGTGSKTISLDAQSIGGATCDYMRSRIYVFRANVFDQMTENESLSESTLASATWTDKNTLAYTPRQTEDVLLLTSQVYGSSSTGSPIATRIYNSTDTTAYADQRSHAINNASADYYSGLTAASLNVSAAKTFKTQYQRSTGTGTVKIKDSRLIAWSMTLSAGNKQRLTTVGTSLDPNDLSATTSTSYVDTNASIAASSLPAGKYLVLWGVRLSSANANEISWAQLVRGSTTIAEKGAEANGQIWAGGYWLGSLDGTEALKIQQKTSLGTATANARTKFIKAIRLDDKLTEDVDYFTTGSQESGSDEVTDAGTASWTTVKSLTKTFHPSTTQDYIVLSDMEISNDDTTYQCQAQLTIDGTSIDTQTLDGEDITDSSAHVVADVASLGTGSKTISLEGKSVQSAKCDFRRSRIYVFRANIFDQVAENESLTESTTTSVGTWVDKTSLTYTPNQAEDVLLIASHMISADNSGTVTSIGIYNSTDAVMLAGPMPHIMNAPSGNYGAVMTADMVNISSAKTYKGQFQMQSGSTTSRTKEARLIAWSMTLKVPQMTQGSYRWFNERDASWWNGSWGRRRKITFNNAASTENLVDFPVRVSLDATNIDYSRTQNSGQDIRFVDPDGTLLKYEIETWNESGTSEVWVKVPQIDAGSSTDFVYMYYDNSGASDGQDSTNTWDSNFKTVLHLDESPANSVQGHDDSTSGNHDGTPQGFAGAAGSTTNATGKISGADHFNTDNDYVNIDDHADYTLSANGNYTWSAWINPDSFPSWSTIWSQTLNGDDLFYIYAHTASDTYIPGGGVTSGVSVWWANGAGAINAVIADSSDNALSSGVDQLVTVTYDASQASGSEFKIYVNGVDVTSGAGTLRGTGTVDLNPTNIRIGSNEPFGEYFDGVIDEMRYQTTLRSPEWIEADYISSNNAMNTFGAEQSSSSFAPLAAQNTAASATVDTPFTLRHIIEQTQGTSLLGVQLRLQYAQKSGTCDTAFSGETYAEVPTSGTGIRYYDTSGATNGSAISTSGDDPTSSSTIVAQHHAESNPFSNNQTAISTGYAGMWDFSLVGGSAAVANTYCFRTIYYNTLQLNSYSQVAEITIQASGGGPTLDQQMRHGRGVIDGVETPLN